MKISDMFKNNKQTVSFEIFPPKLTTPIETIFDKLGILLQWNLILSVWHTGWRLKKGRTVEIASKIKGEYGIESLAHFTCVGHSIEEINALIKEMKDENIDNLLALRGDPPQIIPILIFQKCICTCIRTDKTYKK